jgi:DNA-directed RNA polymerase specialized sigma24 family protein
VDDRRDIVVGVMEAFKADGFRRLEELLALLRQRDGSFRYWLTTVARNAAVDHTRAHPENIGDKGTFCWVKNTEVSGRLKDGRRDPFRGLVASEILALAERMLRPDQREVLLLWISGESYEEIADALQLGSADDAASIRRSAVERLRYHLAREGRRGRGKSAKSFRTLLTIASKNPSRGR